MKKLIAISVVFALLTGAVFAQASIGASAWAGATLVYGNSEQKEGPFSAPGLWGEDEDDYWQHFGATLTFSYETPDAEAGVTFQIKVDARDDVAPAGWDLEDLYDYARTLGYVPDAGVTGFKSFSDFQKAIAKLVTDGIITAEEAAELDYSDFYSTGGEQGTHTNAIFDSFGAWWWAAPGLVRLNMGQAGFDRGDATPFHYIEGSGNWFGITIQPVDMFALNISFIDEDRYGYRGYVGKFADIGRDKDGYRTGTLGDNFGNVFMLQGIAKLDGIGEVGFTYDNWYQPGGDDFASTFSGGFEAMFKALAAAAAAAGVDDYKEPKLAEDPGLRGIFVDFNGEFAGVDVTVGFNYLMGVKEYGSEKMSAWGFGLGLSYGLAEMIGMDLTVGLSYDVGAVMYDGDIVWDKNGGPVMNLGFSVGLVMPVDPFTVTVDASVDLKNLSGEKAAFYYQPAMKKEKDMVMEWEINLGLSREIGGFTFNTGVDIDGNNGEKTGVNYSVPIKFSYAW